MISNIKFGRRKAWALTSVMYVYHNLGGTAFINSNNDDWLGFELDVVPILSHETLHKVIFKLEGGKASSALDKWCRSRKWLWNDDSGVCFFSWEMGEGPEDLGYKRIFIEDL